MKGLFRLALPFFWWIVAAVSLGISTVLASVGLMGVAAFLIATAALHPSIADLQVAIVGVRFFGMSRGIFRYLERLVSHETTFRLLAGLRMWFFRSLASLAPAGLVDFRSSDLLDRAVSDIGVLEKFYTRVMAGPLVALAVMGVVGFWIASMHPTSACFFVLVFATASVVTTSLAVRSSGRCALELTQCRVDLGAGVVDLVQGSADLTAYGRHRQWRDDLIERCRDIARLSRQQGWVDGLTVGLCVFFTHFAVLIVLVVAIPDVADGRLDPVMLAVLCLVVMSAFEPVAALPAAGLHFRLQLESFRRLVRIFDVAPAVRDKVPVVAISVGALSLEFRAVSFAYPEAQRNAIHNLSFALEPGNNLWVVGPSGAGKSTLGHLMLRYWDPQTGSITLGGIDLVQHALDDVRRRIAVVSQHSHLFAGTIADNLRLAKPEAQTEDFERVCRAAQLADFITSLPLAYETWVGEHGHQLSGGQRQRLVIARALLQDPEILVLDEATAQMDVVTATEVLKNVRRLYATRSIIEITHLVHRTRGQDRIVVIDGGSIVERGSHEELMGRNGLYWMMWQAEKARLT